MTSGLAASLVLFAAVLHAGWNAMVKGGRDSFLDLVIILGVAPLLLSPLLLVLPFPALEAWPWLGLSILIHLAYQGLLLAAYRFGDLSRVYPIARGSAPLIVAIAALLFLGEKLSLQEWLGVALVTLAIGSLALEKGLRLDRRDDALAVGFAFATGISIAAYSVIDGIGARASGAPIAYTLWLLLINGCIMLAFAFWRRGFAATLGYALGHGRLRIGAGFLSTAAYSIVLWAYTFGMLGPISALRETSVLFAAVIGRFWLGEAFGPWRMTCALLAVLGLFLISGLI